MGNDWNTLETRVTIPVEVLDKISDSSIENVGLLVGNAVVNSLIKGIPEDAASVSYLETNGPHATLNLTTSENAVMLVSIPVDTRLNLLSDESRAYFSDMAAGETVKELRKYKETYSKTNEVTNGI